MWINANAKPAPQAIDERDWKLDLIGSLSQVPRFPITNRLLRSVSHPPAAISARMP